MQFFRCRERRDLLGVSDLFDVQVSHPPGPTFLFYVLIHSFLGNWLLKEAAALAAQKQRPKTDQGVEYELLLMGLIGLGIAAISIK